MTQPPLGPFAEKKTKEVAAVAKTSKQRAERREERVNLYLSKYIRISETGLVLKPHIW